MSKKIFLLNLQATMMVAMLSLGFVSCGGDDDIVDPNVGQPTNPNTPVNDPEGTITLSMRNKDNGDTRLDNIYIDKENFKGASFASVGAVMGLGNVSNIPTSGWAEQMSVIAGHGYVAYGNNQFYRIYVVSDIAGTSGGIIGADIKYQKPFKGVDEAISIDEEALTFTSNGGSQSLVFNNKNIVVFSATSNQSWCRVQKSSTHDKYFLYNAVTIIVDANTTPNTDNAVVTLTTTYGKKTELNITRLGTNPILEVAKNKTEISAEEQELNIGFITNYKLDDLELLNPNDWLSAEIINGTRSIQSKAVNIKFIGTQGDNYTRSGNDNNASSYYIKIKASANFNKANRNANITLRSKDNKQNQIITVTQKGVSINCEKESITVDANENTNIIQIMSPFIATDLNAICDVSWCKASFMQNGNNVYMSVKCDLNRNSNQRTANITITAKNSDTNASFSVIQNGASIELAQSELTINANNNTKKVQLSSPFDATELKASSNADWCSASFSKNGNNVNMTVTCEVNNTDQSRNTTLSIYAENSDVKTELLVTQQGLTIDGVNEVWFDSRQSNYTITIKTSPEETSWFIPKSNQSWCSVSKNNNSLIIRCEATTTDREAILTFDNFKNYKIVIHQSKYKEGDVYSEGMVTGTVLSMSYDGKRIIYKDLGAAQWSTEKVETGAIDRNDGLKNMTVIKAIPNWKNLYPAFALVDELNSNGVTGWYMPAYNQGVPIGYWSSTEANSHSAYYHYHASSYPYIDNMSEWSKDGYKEVRALYNF